MATHDYVISNASGAAVRADLNNALAAIVSNNSNATEPSTTYSYMLWADTGSSPPVMKLRNAANDGWVTLFQLDGEWSVIPFENGTAAAPSIYFKDSGTDTGFFSGGTDQVNITTGGTERVEWGTSEVVFNDGGENYDFRIEGDTNANLFFVDASADAVGIGTTAPSGPFEVVTGTEGGFRITDGGVVAGVNFRGFRGSSNNNVRSIALDVQDFIVSTGAPTGTTVTERARIDSSGRLLINTSSARSNFGGNTSTPLIQTEGTTAGTSSASIVNNSAGVVGSTFNLSKTRATSVGGNTVVASGDEIGIINFQAADGTNLLAAASIQAAVDGTPGANDMPGRLVFSTTADGGSSPTERMRIKANGFTKFSSSGSYYNVNSGYHEFVTPDSEVDVLFWASNASYSSQVLVPIATRSASSAYSFFFAYSGNGADTEFNLRGDGTGYSDGGWTTPASDYAEYFEWEDGNPDNEDRRGISVVLDGTTIREAVAGEEPFGIISARPSIVGDAATEHWKEKYLTDDFGSYIMEPHNVVSWTDEEGKEHQYEDFNIPTDIVIPDDAVISTVDEKGVPFTHRKLNPDYDPNQAYISREHRPEWDTVGLLGKLRMRKGQVTGSRWIKMRDISNSVEEWLVR